MVPAVLRLARLQDVELAGASLQPVSGEWNAFTISLNACRVPNPANFATLAVVHQPRSAVALTHAVPGPCTPVPDRLHEIIGLVLGVRAWGNVQASCAVHAAPHAASATSFPLIGQDVSQARDQWSSLDDVSDDVAQTSSPGSLLLDRVKTMMFPAARRDDDLLHLVADGSFEQVRYSDSLQF